MPRTNFENLQVYQLSETLADELWGIVSRWRGLARDTMGKQLVRAADSVGANIAEGTGRGSQLDHRRFARVARGSLYETRHWLRRAYRRHLLTKDQVASLRATLDSLTRKLNAYLSALDRPGPERGSKTNRPRPKT
jgi:four helix bundle protein